MSVLADVLAVARRDPFALRRFCWPDARAAPYQDDITLSVRDNDETDVVSAHKVGKDHAAGFTSLWAFLAHPVARVVTSAVKDDNLDLLWGEIERFIQSSRVPLTADKGGPLVVNHHEIRKLTAPGRECPISYLKGAVSKGGEGMAGHHAPYTLFVFDEASGMDDRIVERTDSWAKRRLLFGNPYPCENAWRKAVEAGDLPDPERPGRYLRKVIRIRGQDSPNVRLALAQRAKGLRPTGKELVPGVLSWEEYQKRRATWDAVKQCVGLDAEWWQGSDALLFPPDWLNRSEDLADALKGRRRKAKAAGVDSAAGGDLTALVAVDELGVLDVQALKTPDTAQVTGLTLAFLRKHGLEPRQVAFDAGGGGQQHADRLRAMGYKGVRVVSFGEAATPPPQAGRARLTGQAQAEARGLRYAYRNRRAQMYGELSELLDPSHPQGFAVPREYAELRRQLAPFPKLYDGEGRLFLPPKRRKGPGGGDKSLEEILGCSPDHADALVLSVFCMLHPEEKRVLRAF